MKIVTEYLLHAFLSFLYPFQLTILTFISIITGTLYYMQSLTPHLSMGGEVFWAGQARKSGVGYAARYNTDKMVRAISNIIIHFCILFALKFTDRSQDVVYYHFWTVTSDGRQQYELLLVKSQLFKVLGWFMLTEALLKF